MTVSAVRPWRKALQTRTLFAFRRRWPGAFECVRRLASIRLRELIEDQRGELASFDIWRGRYSGISRRRFWVGLLPKPLRDVSALLLSRSITVAADWHRFYDNFISCKIITSVWKSAETPTDGLSFGFGGVLILGVFAETGDILRRALVVIALATTLLGTNQISYAADLPVKAPAYTAPAPVALYNWNGFYVGGNVGYGWDKIDSTSTNVATGEQTSASSNRNGVFGSSEVGYNWQFNPNFLLGVEGDIDAANLTGSSDGCALDRLRAFGW